MSSYVSFKFDESSPWVEEVISVEEIVPHYSAQEQATVHNLLKYGSVQGISSNVPGDNACITTGSFQFLERFPRINDETMEQYYERIFGPHDEEKRTDAHKEARDALKQMQIQQEYGTMHAYHFDEFKADPPSSFALRLNFFDSHSEKHPAPNVPDAPRHLKRKKDN